MQGLQFAFLKGKTAFGRQRRCDAVLGGLEGLAAPLGVPILVDHAVLLIASLAPFQQWFTVHVNVRRG